MLQPGEVDASLLQGVDAVVEELTDRVGLHDDDVLLVGAACRDALHSGLGHRSALRGTTDLDLGIALSDWTTFDRIRTAFPPLGDSKIRFSIAGTAVDVIPFGPVEDPEGISSPSTRDEDVVVFGFTDTYERASPLPLSCGATIRLPSPAGYAALKMRAWLDRRFDSDAADLALASYWYQQSEVVSEHLWSTNEGQALLARLDHDVDLAATALLGRHVIQLLSPASAADLQMRWHEADKAMLARHFHPGLTDVTVTPERQRELVQAFDSAPA